MKIGLSKVTLTVFGRGQGGGGAEGADGTRFQQSFQEIFDGVTSAGTKQYSTD